MTATTARLLSVLSALQSGGATSGPDLAERLGVTERTVRRDIDRLRQLGYAIDATRGPTGAYTLGAWGAALPPLMVDREEMVALAACVLVAAADSVVGGADAASRALAKLRQSLPPAARQEADALAEATVRLSGGGDRANQVDHEVLLAVSMACRGRERIRLSYRDAAGVASERRVDPHRVVNVYRRWYLAAWDLDRRAWRTFRLDRIAVVTPTGHTVDLVDPPDAVELVQEAVTLGPYRHRVVLTVAAPIEVVEAAIPPTVARSESVGPAVTRVELAGDVDYLVGELAGLDLEWTVEAPPEVASALRQAGLRLLRAVGTDPGGPAAQMAVQPPST